jgi:dTDP-4-amino-4,6-dideoxygalactose transaminase
VIEDSAQSIGAQYKDGRKSGNVGLMGCYSFYPSKNLGAFGDGGLLTTNDSTLFTKLKQMRVHGAEPKYYHKFVGGNFRLDALQAAVINVKIPHLESWHSARRRNADLYTKLFIEAGLANNEHISCGGFATCPTCSSDTNREFASGVTILLPNAVWQSSGVENYHIYNQYTIRVKRRDAVKNFLKEKGIGSEVYYPVPFHRQECFAYLGAKNEDYLVANCLADTALSLPIYPELVPAQIEYVVAMLAECMKG